MRGAGNYDAAPLLLEFFTIAARNATRRHRLRGAEAGSQGHRPLGRMAHCAVAGSPKKGKVATDLGLCPRAAALTSATPIVDRQTAPPDAGIARARRTS